MFIMNDKLRENLVVSFNIQFRIRLRHFKHHKDIGAKESVSKQLIRKVTSSISKYLYSKDKYFRVNVK
jgi:hypothetical protein